MTRISGPKPVLFKAHIDHLENPNRDVWALSFRSRYLVLLHISFLCATETANTGRRRQPRAWITGRGEVWLSEDKSVAQIRSREFVYHPQP
jgi:hypothetical protein